MFSRLFAIIGLMLFAMVWVLYVTGVLGVVRVWDDPIIGVLASVPLLTMVTLAAYIAIRPD